MAVPKGIEPSRHDRQSCIIPVDHETLVAWVEVESTDMNLMRVPSRRCSILASN